MYSALDEAQSLFFKISQAVNPAAGVLIKDLLSGVKAESGIPFLKELQTRQERYQTRGPEDLGITGIPTHFIDIDKLLNGFNNSNLMILAARPAMGKTALAINIAENVCFKNDIPVGLFSLEMSAEQLVHRLICSQAEIESDKIKTGSLNGIEFQRIVAAVNHMQNHMMIIDDQPGLKITDLRARARRMKESYNIGLLIVDYLQLLSGSSTNRSAENRQNEISEISRMLKNLARELDIPLLCLSQLSRRVEDRQGHRPMMSDLRESGCLSGDTLIEDVQGACYTMKELAMRQEQTPIEVLAVDSNNQLTPHLMSRVFYSGKKQLFHLTTKNKASIKASSNHPFLKKEGFTPLENLRKGDLIALSSQSALYWDEIETIAPLGEEDVYDATVPRVHNFVANGIVVHNSIEQDADIVMFLLRREYYDPLDKPGMAEVIVAKNRHGAAGSIHLTFRKEIAQFANYSPMKLNTANLREESFDPFPT